MKDPKDLARVINSLQANIQDSIQPMVQLIQNDSLILKNVSLKQAVSPNMISHTLGRVPVKWNIMAHGAATIYDTQATNKSPQLTLNLMTSADVLVDIEIA